MAAATSSSRNTLAAEFAWWLEEARYPRLQVTGLLDSVEMVEQPQALGFAFRLGLLWTKWMACTLLIPAITAFVSFM